MTGQSLTSQPQKPVVSTESETNGNTPGAYKKIGWLAVERDVQNTGLVNGRRDEMTSDMSWHAPIELIRSAGTTD